MRFTLIAALLSCAAVSTAHIIGISGPTKYSPGTNSKYPLKFTTSDGPITNEDFSVVIGLGNSATGSEALGTFIHNFDLENSGHGSTADGSFTLQVPLPSSAFNNGPGDYVIIAAVTNADGAQWNVNLKFFTTTVTVTGV
ncbi:hypothetical protein PILCRDRAFT_830466 [Piloderma croceum F 1598]|uniref:Uncharacterized protein n=1 Tax=Piloderma croceum (strain F 1598) TaxID=765440 RepID=A0A0C3B1Y7_PILCF|nr:hypothetical protein PILCRDRAFT_830466 [Piloderma croceum F 1598]